MATVSFEQDRGQVSHMRPLDTSSGGDLRGPPSNGSGPLNDESQRKLDVALYAPNGIDKLLNRLKQSIYSARDFSALLKERYALEDRYAQGYKKLVRNSAEALRQPGARQGSYARNFDESLRITDRQAENGLQFASVLYSMADELRDMAENAEKGRKHWKHVTIDAEKKLSDAETAQQKAKDRFNTAAEQYERIRTGERQDRKFGLKNKSPAQQEEALKEKADMLDQDYMSKSHIAQDHRREFENITRPQIVRNLQELIMECDAAMAMQMARLASQSEKHVVSNGMAIAPIKPTEATGPEPRGLRQIAQDIDDRKDFEDYMLDGVEPPPQFKTRSRRNTDAEQVHTPMQSAPNLNRYSAYDSPYNDTQNNLDSSAPQLPQIGNQESFSNSFELQRPNAQNRNSYLGQQSDTPQRGPPGYQQQTGVTQDPTPSLGVGRGMPTAPSLPSFDRAQAPQPGDFSGPTRQGTMGTTNFDQSTPTAREDARGPTSPIGKGPSRQGTMDTAGYTNQNEPRQDHRMSSGFSGPPQQRQNPMGVASYANPEPPRQPTTGPAESARQPSLGRDPTGVASFTSQGPPRHDTTGPQGFMNQTPPRQETTGMGAGRGQPPMNNAPGPYIGRGGPSPGSYMDPGKNHGPYGMTAAGRGQQPGAQRNLPSQQPQRPALPPNNPVFGVHLDELFRRDGTAVPAVVFQCIQAIDLFGLHTEGIYRTSGSTPIVMQLKSEFDHGMPVPLIV